MFRLLAQSWDSELQWRQFFHQAIQRKGFEKTVARLPGSDPKPGVRREDNILGAQLSRAWDAAPRDAPPKSSEELLANGPEFNPFKH